MAFASLKSGLEMFYEADCFAEPWLEPESILLLHGIGRSHKWWNAWVPTLAAELQVIRVDLPGFGYTKRPPGHKWSLSGAVVELVELLDALGLESVHVAGTTLGAALSLAFAAEAPERVRTATLGLHGAALMGDKGKNGRAVDQYAIIEKVQRDGVEGYARDIVTRRIGGASSPEHQRWSIEQSLMADQETWVEAITAVADADLVSLLERVEAPALVMSPSRSQMVPLANVIATMEHLRDPELLVFSTDANDVVIGCPKESARECLSFIKRRSTKDASGS